MSLGFEGHGFEDDIGCTQWLKFRPLSSGWCSHLLKRKHQATCGLAILGVSSRTPALDARRVRDIVKYQLMRRAWLEPLLVSGVRNGRLANEQDRSCGLWAGTCAVRHHEVPALHLPRTVLGFKGTSTYHLLQTGKVKELCQAAPKGSKKHCRHLQFQ